MLHQPIYQAPPIKNLKDMLEQSTALYGGKNAFLLRKPDGTYDGITYSKFKQDTDALGTSLLHLGLQGKAVAVIGEGRYEWCLTYLAVVNGVGIIVPLDKELPLEELKNLLNRSHSCAVVFSGKYEKSIREIMNEVPGVQYFISMDAQKDGEGILSLRNLMSKGQAVLASGDKSYLDARIDEEKMSILLYTSGTTDLAKGVMLSHKNISFDIMAVCQSLYIDSSDSVLSILPLHHTYECTADFLLMLYCGCCISFCEGLKHIAKNLKETSPTILVLVPLILENMYKRIWEQAAKKRGQKTRLILGLAISNLLLRLFNIDIRRKLFAQIHDNIGGKVRLVISGAAALEPKVIKGFRAMGITVIQGYGLTESSPVVAVGRDHSRKDDAIGQPLPGVEVKLVDVNSEGIGELIVKGDNVMLGYYENEQATAAVLKDGWLYTGDLAKVDSDDFYTITGRKKNVIVTKNGKNIYPEEVEAYINQSPLIRESIVFGSLDSITEETDIHARIVPDLEAIEEKLKIKNPEEADIRRLIDAEIKSINRNMPLYKRIQNYSLQENEFEKTTTQKVKRYIANQAANHTTHN